MVGIKCCLQSDYNLGMYVHLGTIPCNLLNKALKKKIYILDQRYFVMLMSC